MNIEATKQAPRKRKSVLLTKDEHRSLKDYRKTFNTGVECAEAIGIDRVVLDRVITIGSGSPETIEKIRKAVA